MNKTITLIIILLVISGGLLAMAFIPQKKSSPSIPTITEITKTPTPVNNQTATLALTPNPLVIASSSGNLDVAINSGENNITAVQIELVYNPKEITTIDITPGTFFDNPTILLKNIDTKNGRLSYAIATSLTGKAKKGMGNVATITFTTAITQGKKTDITFSPKTLVTAEGARSSVLKEAFGASITRQSR